MTLRYGFPMASSHQLGETPKGPVIRVCFESYERSSSYEADVSPDITAAEIIESLTGEDTESWLDRLAPSERYGLILLRTSTEISNTLAEAGARNGDRIHVTRVTHGAGPGPIDVAAGLAVAKLTIDTARVGVDAYRARTERMAIDLEREQFESEEAEPEA
jgi:hypothetical protein